MASRYPRYRAGDAFTPSIINFIFRELERWSNLKGSAGIDVSFADDVGGSPPTIKGSFDVGLIPCVCSAGFAAASIGSPSSATVTLLVASGTGMTATGGTSTTAYHPYTSAIVGSATKIIWLTSFGGRLYTVTADC